MLKKSFFILILINFLLLNNTLNANNTCVPVEIVDSYKQETDINNNSDTSSKSDGFVFIDQTLSMEGFVLRDENNIAEEEYNYLKAMDTKSMLFYPQKVHLTR